MLDLLTKLIDILTPRLTTTDERKALFARSFGNADFLKDVVWDGRSARTFVSETHVLLARHRINGEPALWKLLQVVRDEVGAEVQARIDGLREAVLTFSQTAGRTRLFLSYARADDEPFVKRLHDDLTDKGFTVWWDRVSMPNRGLTFMQEIRDAIDSADRFVLVMGENAAKSEYVQAEWEYARSLCRPINIALRTGDYGLLPPELKDYDALDFRQDADYPTRRDRLVEQLSMAPAKLGALRGTWNGLPGHYITRKEPFRNVINALIGGRTNVAAICAVQGMGGIGKSVLAEAAARDCLVRGNFPNGVIRLEVNPKPDLVNLQATLGRHFGLEPSEFTNDVKANLQRLASRIGEERLLLLLDNVWDKNALDAFAFGLPSVKILITTRKVRIAEQVGAATTRLDVLSPDEGAELILKRTGYGPEQRDLAKQISEALGGQTLAVAIAAGKWKDRGVGAGAALLAAYKAPLENNPFKDLKPTEEDLIELGEEAAGLVGDFEKSLAYSYAELPEDYQRRFRALGVFAADAPFDLAAAAAVWGDESLETAQPKLDFLTRLELAEKTDAGRYRQHSLLRAYARMLLVQAGELAVASERHFTYYAEQYGDFDQNNNEDTHPTIQADFGNIQAALQWGFTHQPEPAVDFAWALNYYLNMRESLAERRGVIQTANDAAERIGYARGQANTLQALGDLSVREDDLAGGRGYYGRALPIYEQIGDRLGQANTLQALGDLSVREADLAGAQRLYDQALSLYESIDENVGIMNTNISVARMLRGQGNREACRYYETTLRIAASIPAFANHPVVSGWRREYQAFCGGGGANSTPQPGPADLQN